MRLVFFGSGEFSRDILANLIGGAFEPEAVITRPDRPKGRGRRLHPTPVKMLAAEEGMSLLQPEDIREKEFKDILEGFGIELAILADYGELLPRSVLEVPQKGCMNVHPSLLPLYRGACPIQRAIMDGKPTTGVTLMLMNEDLDSGPIMFQAEVRIDEEDNALSLGRKLSGMASRLIAERLPEYLCGAINIHPQDEELVTYAYPIAKSELLIDWSRKNRSIHDQVRALSPRPGAYTGLRGKRVKILKTLMSGKPGGYGPGRIIISGKEGLLVDTGRGALEIETLQPEGSRPMNPGEFMRGYRLLPGDVFEDPPRHGV